MDALWQLPVISGPVPWIVYAIAIALVVVLLARKPTLRWVLTAVIGIAAGAILGLGIYLIANALNAFGNPLPLEVGLWAGAAFAGVGLAIVSLWRSPVWRKIVAAFAIIWFLITAMIGINAFYGLNPTLGSIFGISASNPIDIPTPAPTPAPTETTAGPLYETWTPPADMPTVGQQGTQAIPGTVSGFNARDAGIYLPPAALVAEAPALPLVILMMGYPGNPDQSYIAAILDEFAAEQQGARADRGRRRSDRHRRRPRVRRLDRVRLCRDVHQDGCRQLGQAEPAHHRRPEVLGDRRLLERRRLRHQVRSRGAGRVQEHPRHLRRGVPGLGRPERCDRADLRRR